jgi:hypothetical protein
VQKWFGQRRGESVSWTVLIADERFGLSSRLVLKYSAVTSSLAIKQRALEVDPTDPSAITAFISTIPQIVDLTEAMANAGILVFLHDISSATLSQITLQLYKVRVKACHS